MVGFFSKMLYTSARYSLTQSNKCAVVNKLELFLVFRKNYYDFLNLSIFRMHRISRPPYNRTTTS